MPNIPESTRTGILETLRLKGFSNLEFEQHGNLPYAFHTLVCDRDQHDSLTELVYGENGLYDKYKFGIDIRHPKVQANIGDLVLLHSPHSTENKVAVVTRTEPWYYAKQIYTSFNGTERFVLEECYPGPDGFQKVLSKEEAADILRSQNQESFDYEIANLEGKLIAANNLVNDLLDSLTDKENTEVVTEVKWKDNRFFRRSEYDK